MTGYLVRALSCVAEVLGDDCVQAMTGSFSCPRNPEVESFIRGKALQASKLETAVTYLVFRSGFATPIAYFTLTLKAVEIPAVELSGKAVRTIKRFARLNAERDSYTLAAYLIAQIGRNFSVDDSIKINGAELLRLALDQVREAKKRVGGKIAFLECEKNRPKLRKFYEDNKFVAWSDRTDADDQISYDQMFTVVERATTDT